MENPTRAPEHSFKLLIIGNSGVGKSAFLIRLTENMFTPSYSLTIGEGNPVIMYWNVNFVFVDVSNVYLCDGNHGHHSVAVFATKVLISGVCIQKWTVS